MSATLLLGDCLESMRAMPDNSVDAIVTDPPYGMSAPPDVRVVLTAWLAGDAYEHASPGFMGAAWDSFVPGPQYWAEALRVLKPGGHALVFASTRTVDLMGMACRLAGWEVRDTLHWCYWSGFPKGGSIGPRIDAMAGAEREVIGTGGGCGVYAHNGSGVPQNIEDYRAKITAPATPEAAKWEGWHTHLKPAVEPILLLRKPLSEPTIARNVLRWGTGALHIDACRFAQGDSAWPGPQEGEPSEARAAHEATADARYTEAGSTNYAATPGPRGGSILGRYPANLVHFPKPSRAEKEAGCEGLPAMTRGDITGREEGSAGLDNPMAGVRREGEIRNTHNTVKPIALMRWLCRLVTPPGGRILDCFGGSGTTGVAAKLEGFDVTLCEMNPAYVDIARARIKHAAPGQPIEGGRDHEPEGAYQPGLFG